MKQSDQLFPTSDIKLLQDKSFFLYNQQVESNQTTEKDELDKLNGLLNSGRIAITHDYDRLKEIYDLTVFAKKLIDGVVSVTLVSTKADQQGYKFRIEFNEQAKELIWNAQRINSSDFSLCYGRLRLNPYLDLFVRYFLGAANFDAPLLTLSEFDTYNWTQNKMFENINQGLSEFMKASASPEFKNRLENFYSVLHKFKVQYPEKILKCLRDNSSEPLVLSRFELLYDCFSVLPSYSDFSKNIDNLARFIKLNIIDLKLCMIKIEYTIEKGFSAQIFLIVKSSKKNAATKIAQKVCHHWASTDNGLSNSKTMYYNAAPAHMSNRGKFSGEISINQADIASKIQDVFEWMALLDEYYHANCIDVPRPTYRLFEV